MNKARARGTHSKARIPGPPPAWAWAAAAAAAAIGVFGAFGCEGTLANPAPQGVAPAAVKQGQAPQPLPASATDPVPTAVLPAAKNSPLPTDDSKEPLLAAPSKGTANSSVPASILPPGCSTTHARYGEWDGKTRFAVDCQRPSHSGWTKVQTGDEYAAGTVYRTHAYRKSGWMLLFAERCCSSCEPEGISDCEPWYTARLYPPADLKNCTRSQACKQVGLCVQKKSWCEGEEAQWGLSL